VKSLGREFDVDPVMVRRGSIEIIAVITAVAAVIRDYDEFVSKLEEAIARSRSAIRTVIEAIADVKQLLLDVSWVPSAGLLAVQERLPSSPESARSYEDFGGRGASAFQPSSVLFYWILSNTILISVVIVVAAIVALKR
jgi:hypothetical protein